jgi:hypothetical protein
MEVLLEASYIALQGGLRRCVKPALVRNQSQPNRRGQARACLWQLSCMRVRILVGCMR